jgi:crossover junction endodeoxyribonuclease RusA
MEVLTANNRMHYHAKARLTRILRETGVTMARSARLPRLERADITVEYLPPAGRHPLASARIRDAENLAPTGKALIDGITQAGVFADDNIRHVRRVSFEFGPKSKRGQVLLHITEVAP